ncbi:MAG: L-histidine N(alpha)-methyltransferase [Candidatus Methylacidiphilales bacterium]|nr:L-histidine N(alpha)-methyltransferase [Candidatus Methylacidiphilales bacterium]
MPLVPLHFHSSRFPAAVSRLWRESLESREMDHSFHYLTHRQSMRWLAVHSAHSPAKRDEACRRIYHEAFDHMARIIHEADLAVIGLGCGDGGKEAELMRVLGQGGHRPTFLSCDTSSDLILAALDTLVRTTGVRQQAPAVIADLRAAADLGPVWDRWTGRVPRIFTLFGLLPNFTPGEILPVVAGWMRPGDFLLASANLAPGNDYQAGCNQILPQYDNRETRQWLSGVLEDLGVERNHFSLDYRIGEAGGLKRVEVWATFRSDLTVQLEGREYAFDPGDRMRLFFSNRHTLELMSRQLETAGLESTGSWLAPSGEEGVWLAVKKGSAT